MVQCVMLLTVLRCGVVGCPSVNPETRLALRSAVSVRASGDVQATVATMSTARELPTLGSRKSVVFRLPITKQRVSQYTFSKAALADPSHL
jgi:hypothetical protein